MAEEHNFFWFVILNIIKLWPITQEIVLYYINLMPNLDMIDEQRDKSEDPNTWEMMRVMNIWLIIPITFGIC